MNKSNFSPALLTSLVLAVSIGSASAEDIERPTGANISLKQVIVSEQTDATGARHQSSSITIDTYLYFFDERGPSVGPVPEITLPAGATGSIPRQDFTVVDTTASYHHESTEEVGLDTFPTGEHQIVYRSDDGVCELGLQFVRPDFFTEFATAGSHFPNIRNQGGWRDGKLRLPIGAQVVLWDRMGVSREVEGDSEQQNRLVVTDPTTGERVVDVYAGQVFSSPKFALDSVYPHYVFADQDGINLRAFPLTEGKDYHVSLSKTRSTIFISGDHEVEMELVSRLEFQVVIDPDLPVPPVPKLEVKSNDEAGTFSISWAPDAETIYIVESASVYLTPEFRFIEGTYRLFSVPLPPGGQNVFTQEMEDEWEYFRVLAIPR